MIKKYFIVLNNYFISFLLVNNIVKIFWKIYWFKFLNINNNKENSYYITKKLKQINIDNSSISKATGLSIDEINKL